MEDNPTVKSETIQTRCIITPDVEIATFYISIQNCGNYLLYCSISAYDSYIKENRCTTTENGKLNSTHTLSLYKLILYSLVNGETDTSHPLSVCAMCDGSTIKSISKVWNPNIYTYELPTKIYQHIVTCFLQKRKDMQRVSHIICPKCFDLMVHETEQSPCVVESIHTVTPNPDRVPGHVYVIIKS